jgi:hypothetical protein
VPAAAGETRAAIASRPPTARAPTNAARSTGCTLSATGAEVATGVRASYGPGVRTRGRRNRKVPSASASVAATSRPPTSSATGSPASAGTTLPSRMAGFP